MKRTFSFHIEQWATLQPFRIAGRTFETFDCVVAELIEDDHMGRGEALGVFYTDDQLSTVVSQLEAVRTEVCNGITREDLQHLLQPGGARHCIDMTL